MGQWKVLHMVFTKESVHRKLIWQSTTIMPNIELKQPPVDGHEDQRVDGDQDGHNDKVLHLQVHQSNPTTRIHQPSSSPLLVTKNRMAISREPREVS